MRPTGGIIAAVATTIIATKTSQAFVVQDRVSSWRTGAASQHQERPPATCSAIDNRRFRRAPPAITRSSAASASAQEAVEAAAVESGEEGEAEGPGAEDAELSCSGVGHEEERTNQKWRWAAGRGRRALLRGAASFATFSVGTTALSGVSADLQHRINARGDGEAVMSMPGAMKSAEASVFKPFEKRTVEEKLANLPAFMVTNAKGSPYLSPTEANEPQMAVFFTNLDDAKENLREMVQSPAYQSDARILVVSMEKAYSMVKAGPRGTGYQREDGREEMMDFKLERDMHSFYKARRLGLDVSPAAVNTPIPVFYAEGLEIKRDGGLVKPLFMDPADLVAAWKKAVASNPEMPATPTVKVFNMPDVMVAMELTDEFKEFGFFASTDSAEYIRQGRESKKPAPKPRLGRMWAF